MYVYLAILMRSFITFLAPYWTGKQGCVCKPSAEVVWCCGCFTRKLMNSKYLFTMARLSGSHLGVPVSVRGVVCVSE